MNTTASEPITGPGINWVIGQINKRFEQAVADADLKDVTLTREEEERVKKEYLEKEPS